MLKITKILTLLSLSFSPSLLAATDSTEGPESPAHPFVDFSEIDKTINELGSVARKTETRLDSERLVKTALDIHLKNIDKTCDIVISYQFLKLGYAVQSGMQGAKDHLRKSAELLAEKSNEEFRGVGPQCRSSLKSFSTAILRVYLGNSWNKKEN